MTWIQTISEDEADGFVKRFYDGKQAQLGFVPNIIKAFSLSPEILRTSQAFFKALMFGPLTLSRPQREMIAIVVSKINECHY
ncbi:MAG: peroxidase [Nitrospinota bacterium]